MKIITDFSEKDQARFWAKVALPNEQGCMLWLKSTKERRYAEFSLPMPGGRRIVAAHRFSYVLAYGPVPDGLVVDHVKARGCTSTLCMAPNHLEAVTQRENVRRGSAPTAINGRKTHCINGHPFTQANTYKESGKYRKCRACLAVRQREYLERKKNRRAGDPWS